VVVVSLIAAVVDDQPRPDASRSVSRHQHSQVVVAFYTGMHRTDQTDITGR
jgi:hypothetical protein